MTDPMQKVDVIIPVLNGERTIQAAIDSALDQEGVAVTVTVVDAGSSDGTLEIVQALEDHRVHLISGMGPLPAGAARNIGVDESHSMWLAFLDSDDLWPRYRTQHLLGEISDPLYEIAVGHMITFPDGAFVDTSLEWPLTNSQLAPIPGCVMMSRGLFHSVGPFDTDLPVGEFIDWLSRARDLGIKEAACANVVLLRRNHSLNTSRSRRSEYPASVLRIALSHRARIRGMAQGPGAPSGQAPDNDSTATTFGSDLSDSS